MCVCVCVCVHVYICIYILLKDFFYTARWQHPTIKQLYSHLPPIRKTIKIRRNRHARLCWRSKDELISDIPPRTSSHG